MFKKTVFVVWLLLSSVFMVVNAQQAAPSVAVTGAVTTPLTLTVDELAKMPRATASITSNGVETKYEGVWLYEILKKAGVASGEALRGRALTTYVLAEAQDGYQVIFSVGELDPLLGEAPILLADKANDKPLFGE